MQFNAYYGCDRCKTWGKMVQNKMTFPGVKEQLRTDAEYRSNISNNQLVAKGISPFTIFPQLDMVKHFNVDIMHSTFIGVTKKILHSWINGTPDFRGKLTREQIENINRKIKFVNQFLPSKLFENKPHTLSDLERLEAHELKALLLYHSFYVFKDLPQPLYSNFLLFAVAITIYVSKSLLERYSEYAQTSIISISGRMPDYLVP